MNKFVELFASLFTQNSTGESGGDNVAHHEAQGQYAIAAQSFLAALQMIQAGLGEGKDLEAELRARAQHLTDMADLVHAAKAAPFGKDDEKDKEKEGDDKEKDKDKEADAKKDE